MQRPVRLAAFQIGVDPVQIVAMFRRIGIAYGIDFAQNFVLPRLLLRTALRECRWSFWCTHAGLRSFPLRDGCGRWRYDGNSRSAENRTLRPLRPQYARRPALLSPEWHQARRAALLSPVSSR